MDIVPTPLCQLFLKYHSDKAEGDYRGHSYSPVYYSLLKDRQHLVKNLLEIGIGTKESMDRLTNYQYTVGASIKAWKEFFINAKVYALDIDKNVLFEEDRLKCFYADQSDNNSLLEAVNSIYKYSGSEFLFDIIIDDGSHWLHHQMSTIKFLSKYLIKDGIYIVEDVKACDLDQFKSLAIEGLELIHTHNGRHGWDSFAAYKRL